VRSLTIVTGAALATIAICATPAAAATVSPSHVRFPQVAVNASGRTAVAWEREVHGRFTVEARIGDRPGRLGSTHTLARLGYQPRLAVGPDGTAAALWSESGPGRDVRIRVAIAAPGHGFGRARTIDQRKNLFFPIAVAVQPGGRVVAIWPRSSGRLSYALGSRKHGFGAAREVTAVGSIAPQSVAVDPRDGTVLVAYPTPLGLRPPVNSQAGVRTLTATAPAFSEPTVLSATGIIGEAVPAAVAGPGGSGVAFRLSGLPGSVRFARRAADGSFAASQQIAVAAPGTFAVDVGVALPTDGAAVAAWSLDTDGYEPMGRPLGSQTVGSVALPGAVFGAAQALSPLGRRFSAPSVVAAGAEAFVATAVAHGPVLLAVRAPGAAILGAPVVLTRTGDGDVALAAGGSHVLAAFQVDDRLRLSVLR
jgi:hypothetical protein